MIDLLHDLRKEGHTILLVTHDMDIAKQGDQILQIFNGKVSNDVFVSNS